MFEELSWQKLVYIWKITQSVITPIRVQHRMQTICPVSIHDNTFHQVLSRSLKRCLRWADKKTIYEQTDSYHNNATHRGIKTKYKKEAHRQFENKHLYFELIFSICIKQHSKQAVKASSIPITTKVTSSLYITVIVLQTSRRSLLTLISRVSLTPLCN